MVETTLSPIHNLAQTNAVPLNFPFWQSFQETFTHQMVFTQLLGESCTLLGHGRLRAAIRLLDISLGTSICHCWVPAR